MKLFKHRPSPAMIVAMFGLFVGLGGVGLAANGQSLILGQSNSATAQTGLKANTSSAALAITNSVGSPLKLNAPQGVAPLAVSNGTKVAGLNADKLDGKDATDFYAAGSKVADSNKVDGAQIVSNRIVSTTFNDYILTLPPFFGDIRVASCDHTKAQFYWNGGVVPEYLTWYDVFNPGDSFQGVSTSQMSSLSTHHFATFQLARDTGASTKIATVTVTTNAADCVFAAQAVVQPVGS
jgi:hypothetical protein